MSQPLEVFCPKIVRDQIRWVYRDLIQLVLRQQRRSLSSPLREMYQLIGTITHPSNSLISVSEAKIINLQEKNLNTAKAHK